MKYSKDKIMSHIDDYSTGSRKKLIRGWWKNSMFEIHEALNQIQQEQNIKGNLCEIGTWFGRSFLPLRNFTEDDEMCIGVDIFRRDKRGDYYTEVINNVKKCFGSFDRCELIRATGNMTADEKYDSIKTYTPMRIFYIDGDHKYAGALTDLNVAKMALHKDGIMFLDDYDNPNQGPPVVKAVNEFLNKNKEFVLAFTSTQRVFLCRKHMLDVYVNMMSNLNWNEGKDKIWTNLINFEHPLGYDSWEPPQEEK